MTINITGILIALLIGAIAGFLLNSAILNEIAGGTIGAVILLFVISVVKKAT